MYRQWRECTKAAIKGWQPKYKKHTKITEEYLVFARQQLHQNPSLGPAYQQNHGIIKMRDDFLASRGLRGADIIRQEELDGELSNNAVTKDVILVPAATIGCGKTTVALGLCKLFDWGHVQNDNITVKKGKPQAFATACVNALSQASAMIADRNNHQKRERQQLIQDVSRIVTKAKFVALHFVHDDYNKVREVTRERVLTRGDNHQTIHTSKGSDEIIGIMEGFLHRFEPVNQEAPPDDGFDLVIDLDPAASSRENLETVVSKMYAEYPALFAGQDMPTPDDMDAAIDAAMRDYTVDIKHEIKGRDEQRQFGKKQQNGSAGASNGGTKMKERKVEYFAVQVSATAVNRVLEAVFRDVPAEDAKIYNILKALRRVQSEFHVTLIHRAASGQHTDLWTRLSEIKDKAAAPTEERAYATPEPKLGDCKVRLERLVWNDRVMAFVVRLNSPDGSEMQWQTVNPIAHITVGTASANIKPVESNMMLEKWIKEGSGENGISELLVKGVVELDGTVKGVLQRL